VRGRASRANPVKIDSKSVPKAQRMVVVTSQALSTPRDTASSDIPGISSNQATTPQPSIHGQVDASRRRRRGARAAHA